MDTKISKIISILPADLQPLLLQHKEFIALLGQVVASYEERVAFLESEIKRLKDQLKLDSHNSSKPTQFTTNSCFSGRKSPNIAKLSTISEGNGVSF